MRNLISFLKCAIPQTKAEIAGDVFWIAGLIWIFVAGQIGLLP